MFGIDKILKSLKSDKPDVMIGLCHNCFKSGVKLSTTYDILCDNCAPEEDIRPEKVD